LLNECKQTALGRREFIKEAGIKKSQILIQQNLASEEGDEKLIDLRQLITPTKLSALHPLLPLDYHRINSPKIFNEIF
jgi:hypothetical protein